MRYIKFTGGNGYCGCDIEDYAAYEDISDEELNNIAEIYALDNGSTYEYVATGWGRDWECEEDRDYYYDGCWCIWEEISKEEFEESV